MFHSFLPQVSQASGGGAGEDFAELLHLLVGGAMLQTRYWLPYVIKNWGFSIAANTKLYTNLQKTSIFDNISVCVLLIYTPEEWMHLWNALGASVNVKSLCIYREVIRKCRAIYTCTLRVLLVLQYISHNLFWLILFKKICTCDFINILLLIHTTIMDWNYSMGL